MQPASLRQRKNTECVDLCIIRYLNLSHVMKWEITVDRSTERSIARSTAERTPCIWRGVRGCAAYILVWQKQASILSDSGRTKLGVSCEFVGNSSSFVHCVGCQTDILVLYQSAGEVLGSRVAITALATYDDHHSVPPRLNPTVLHQVGERIEAFNGGQVTE